MPALASTLPPALPRPPVDPIGFLVRALAHVRTATTLLPAATVEAPLQLPASSVAPPFMPALAFALPPALPRSPAEPIDLLVHALAHVHAATALPPAAPHVEAPLLLGAFSAGPPFAPALASAFPPTLPRSPADSTGHLAPALAPRLLYRQLPLYQRPLPHTAPISPTSLSPVHLPVHTPHRMGQFRGGWCSTSTCSALCACACLDPPRRKSPYSSGLYKSRLDPRPLPQGMPTAIITIITITQLASCLQSQLS